jgi:signal transduction histidine kinase
VDRSLARHVGGCGLGLAIVRRIVDAHGGSICVESERRKGSVFTVELPILSGAGPPEERPR